MLRAPAAGAARPVGAAHRWLEDAPDRSYAAKLERFERFAAPELRRIFADLGVEGCAAALDVGCGTGLATSLLANAIGSATAVVGVDLSLPHLAAARRNHALLVQSDAMDLALRDAAFDLIWSCNTLHHLADPAAGLRRLARHLRGGARIVVAQSGFVPEMFFAWDAPLDETVRAACHRYYRDRYGLEPSDTAGVRGLIGHFRVAGFASPTARTYVLERTQPLTDDARDYFRHTVFDGTWGDRLAPYLSGADREKLHRNCASDSPDYCLDRPDFHHLQTLTVCEGRVPGGIHALPFVTADA